MCCIFLYIETTNKRLPNKHIEKLHQNKTLEKNPSICKDIKILNIIKQHKTDV